MAVRQSGSCISLSNSSFAFSYEGRHPCNPSFISTCPLAPSSNPTLSLEQFSRTVSSHFRVQDSVQLSQQHLKKSKLLKCASWNKLILPVCSASSNSVDTSNTRLWPLPPSIDDSIIQAQAACRRAIESGQTRIRVDLLLPLIGATDLDDWPGGIQQQYKAAAPLAVTLLNGVMETNRVDYKLTILDDGDAVAEFENDKVALFLFGTAETIPRLQELSVVENRPLLLVNPQWQSGQVISDFGIGARREEAENLVKSFSVVYSLKRIRIRSQDVIIFNCYPSGWQVFLGDSSGTTTRISVEEEMPSYKRLETILRDSRGSEKEKSWFERLKDEFNFNKDSLNTR